jgi:hypothetical protein
MPNPSPLRKIVPALVWPAGVLLLVGYCWVGERMEERRIPPQARQEIRDAAREVARAPGSVRREVIAVESAELRSVGVAFPRTRAFGGQIPLVAVLCVVLVVAVVWRTNAKDKAERQRAADEMP